MAVNIRIATDNAAFENGGAELARILRELAHKADQAGELRELHHLPIRDLNGNRVGLVKVTR